jgi:hypothetical protein
MGKRATITVNLTDHDLDFKSMLSDLRNIDDLANPYFGRSESDIVKMMLKRILPAEHQQISEKISRKVV